MSSSVSNDDHSDHRSGCRAGHHQRVGAAGLVVAPAAADRDEAVPLVQPLRHGVVHPDVEQHPARAGRGQQIPQQRRADPATLHVPGDANREHVRLVAEDRQPCVPDHRAVEQRDHVVPGVGLGQLVPERGRRPALLGEQLVLQPEHRLDVPPPHPGQLPFGGLPPPERPPRSSPFGGLPPPPPPPRSRPPPGAPPPRPPPPSPPPPGPPPPRTPTPPPPPPRSPPPPRPPPPPPPAFRPHLRGAPAPRTPPAFQPTRGAAAPRTPPAFQPTRGAAAPRTPPAFQPTRGAAAPRTPPAFQPIQGAAAPRTPPALQP